MLVFREVAEPVDELKCGDRFSVTVNSTEYRAVVIDEMPDGVLCLFDDCLKDAVQMNSSNNTIGGYEESDLRKYLKSLDFNIDYTTDYSLVPNENGDILFLLTMEQVFGLNENWYEIGGRIEWMKDIRHSIASRDDKPEWWWLRDVVSGIYFAGVNCYGGVGGSRASNSYGVRPAFMLKKREPKKINEDAEKIIQMIRQKEFVKKRFGYDEILEELKNCSFNDGVDMMQEMQNLIFDIWDYLDPNVCEGGE